MVGEIVLGSLFDLEAALTVLKDKGYTLSQLIPIQQRGCRYEDAFIK